MTTVKGWMQNHHPEWEDDPEYIGYGVLLDITRDVCRVKDWETLIEKSGLSKKLLDKFLNAGELRISILSLVKIATALNKKLVIKLEERGNEDE